MNYQKRLFSDKFKYLINRRKKVNGCILCNLVKNDPDTIDVTLYRNNDIIISLNLYPYNPGHIIVFPVKHIVNIKKVTNKLNESLHLAIKNSVSILDNVYCPQGYNIGLNIGHPAGASIKHLHWHIVPRYKNESGLLEIMSGTKIIIESVEDTFKKLIGKFNKI